MLLVIISANEINYLLPRQMYENIFMLYKNAVSNFNHMFQKQILEVHKNFTPLSIN